MAAIYTFAEMKFSRQEYGQLYPVDDEHLFSGLSEVGVLIGRYFEAG